MGSVTSATFTSSWRISAAPVGPRVVRPGRLEGDADPVVEPRRALVIFFALQTKYGQQSQFDPNVIDPVTGLMGAITHPTGVIGKRDWNNFQPRLGLAWNFSPKWVFRASFDVLTIDSPGTGGFDEYAGTYNILQPTGSPNPVFQLQNGPGTIQYQVNPNGTVPYTGASFSSRTATWRDPNLRSPYVMNWSAGFQYQFAPTWMLKLTYKGTAGVALERSWNINQIPLSIALGGNTALQNHGIPISAELHDVPAVRRHQLPVEL